MITIYVLKKIEPNNQNKILLSKEFKEEEKNDEYYQNIIRDLYNDELEKYNNMKAEIDEKIQNMFNFKY